MISAKYAWPAAALLVVALVPTVMHVYRSPAELAPGRLAARIPQTLGPFGPAEPGRRSTSWARRRFSATDFVSRRYQGLHLFGARTYDAKKLFHYPELALTYGHAATSDGMAQVDTAQGPVPARRLEFQTTNSVAMAIYALFYEERAIENPYAFLFAALPDFVLGRRAPMTLLYVQGEAAPGDADALERRLRSLLAAAAEAYRG